MKLRYKILFIGVIILSALTWSGNAFGREKQKDEKHKTAKPQAWPPQVITEKTIQIGPVHVVNFKQLADSQAAHPVPFRTGFIKQGEDKDAEFKFTPHPIPDGTPAFSPDELSGHHDQALQQPHQPESPAPTGYFLGTTSNGSEIPPDVDGSAGPVYVLETNNQQYDIYNKTGVLQMTLNIQAFFNATGGNGFYDPHVLYDPNYQKYILVSDGFFGANGTNPGGVFVAISETSDPTGNWYTYGINDGDNNQNDLLDYPEVGYNNNWVVITCNNFLSNSTPANIYVLSRASLYSGTLGTVKLFTDNNSFSWAPAQTYDLNEDTLWMVQDGNGGSGAMQVGSITGAVANPVYNAGANIAVTQKWNENAIDVGQKGGGTNELINDDDTRVGNGSVYINGTLWFAHTIYLPVTGTATYAGVDWWQIVPSSLTLKQFGRIADPAGNTNYYYPSMNVNSNGDALVGYCMSGTDSFYPSAAYSFHAGADPVNYMESRYIYKPGTVTYYETLGGNRNRYGDFTGTSVDPNDQSFWNYSEYPVNATTWGIVIAHVAPSVPPSNPPVANFMANGTSFDCSGVVQFTDISTNDPTSWLWSFGDGTTSTLQNPSHQYTTNGTFTVTLKATNTHGSGTASYAAYITINLPAAPTAANVTHCSSSTFSLSAATTNHVAWFDSTGTLVSTLNPFVTPAISHTTTYWVQDTVPSPLDSVGPATYSTLGTGGTFANTNSHYLMFDALDNFTLISVLVDASSAGARTIQLFNSAGTVVATATPNIPVGVSTVTLNFSVPAAKGYQLALATGTSNANLYRNNAGGNTNYYPFTVANVVSITGSDAGPGYYYYFYNWKVKGAGCVSAQTPVSAIVGSGGLTITPTITAVACYGQSTGTVALTTTGGTPNYTYSWSNNQTTGTASNLVAATYMVTVTDASGCSSTASETVTQPTAALTASATVTNVTCFGLSNGAVNLTPTGGTTNYTYHWTGGATSQNLGGVVAGIYMVTVTDAHSCTATASATVSQPTAALTANATATNATCYGLSNGAVNLTPTGGTTNYTYHWTGGATTQNLSGVVGGTYVVTVTDSHSCTATASATVSQPAAIVGTVSPVNAACGGSATGSASVSVSGGNGGYTYLWSNSQTTDTISNLSGASYTVTITDTHSCTATASATVSQPGLLTASATATNVSCYGLSNGAVNLTPAGGTTNYTYHWTGGATTQNLSGVVAGIYMVTVTDAHSCTATASATVSQPAAALTANATATNATCNGLANGAVNLTASGGTTNYAYNWTGGYTTPNLSNVGAGTYTVTVTDAHSCTASASATVSQPAALTASTTATNAICNGLSNGAVNLIASGGTINYTYSWTGGYTTANLSGVTAGIYTVTITDAHSCTATASATVNQPGAIILSVSAVNAACGVSSSGSASVSASGGSGSYTYLWSNSQTTDTISNLSGGTYSVTVTDTHICTAIASAIVNNSGSLNVTTAPVPVSCYGLSNGSASVSETGGTGNITYTWTGGGSGPAISNLAAGNYSVTVSDAAGCTSIASALVTQPDSISITLITSSAACGVSNGSVNAIVTGGTSGYGYRWNTSASTPAIGGLSGGLYSVTVTDANTCTGVKSAVVSSTSSLVADLIASNATCYGASNGSASAVVTSGTAPFSYLWSNNSTTSLIHNLIAGTYYVSITDSFGCHSYDSVSVNQPSAIVIIINASQPICNGTSTGAAGLAVTGGTPGYTYIWSNNSTDSSVSALIPGNYSVTVQDGNGCSATSGLTINSVSNIMPTIIAVADSCYGGQNGEARVTATGGSGTYTYLWNNNATTPAINNLAAGNYQVTVTDNHNCTGTSSITVSQPSQLSITTTSVNATIGLSNGSAIIDSIKGGTMPYSVNWSNQQSGDTISNLAPGIYTVTVVDANGCQETANDTIKNVTDIGDLVNAIDFNIYPNPANTKVIVNVPAIGSQTEIWLKDVLGQVLYIRPVSASKTAIDLATYANGIYFIEVTEGPNHSTQKLIIDK